jgi:hypothetical protein
MAPGLLTLAGVGMLGAGWSKHSCLWRATYRAILFSKKHAGREKLTFFEAHCSSGLVGPKEG